MPDRMLGATVWFVFSLGVSVVVGALAGSVAIRMGGDLAFGLLIYAFAGGLLFFLLSMVMRISRRYRSRSR